jgi:hypothetical protein
MKKYLITLGRIKKGFVLLFLLNLLLFSITFIIQSCQSNDLFSDNKIIEAENSFKSTAFNSLYKLNNITLQNKTNNEFNTASRINGEVALIEVYLSNDTSSTPSISENLNLNELVNIDNIDLKVKYLDGSESDNIANEQTLVNTYQISVSQAQQALEPTLIQAKNYLYAKGLTDSDIQFLLAADEEGPAMQESALIPIVMQLIAVEQNQNVASNVNYLSFFGSSAHASQIGECAGDALGFSAIAGLAAGSLETSAGKAILKKAIRKIASRALGWVGAAIFTYEFGDCMGWW